MAKSIVIVGGGIAGLTTAYYLMKQGRDKTRPFDITILEADTEPGGQARAYDVPIAGATGDPPPTFVVEHGSHVFFHYYVNIIQIIAELRADPDIGPAMPELAPVPGWTIVDAYGTRATLTQVSWLPTPYSAFPSILQIPWLPLADRLRMGLAALKIINVPFDQFAELDKKTSQELALDAGYTALGAQAWNSASLGLTNLFIYEQSGAIFGGKHKLLINVPNGLSYKLPAGNLSELIPRPLKKKLDKQGVRTLVGANVTRVGRASSDARTRVDYTGPDGAAATIEADHVVMALRAHDAAVLLPWVKAPWTTLGPVTHVITVVMRLSAKLTGQDDRELGLSREQWVFSVITDLSQYWPEYQGGDKTVLRAEIGHSDLLPRDVDTPADEIMHLVQGDLERLFPEIREKGITIEAYAIRAERTHLYTKWARGEWAKKPKDRDVGQGIYLAGDWTSKGTIGMEAAANSGIEAANHVLEAEGLPPIPYQDVPL